MDIIKNNISDIISSAIGGFLAISIAIWQVRKQINLSITADKKKKQLICKKIDLYFSGIKNLFKSVREDNMKNNNEYHINVTRKPQILKEYYNIINDLVELIGILSETEIDELFQLYNKINETYNNIYNNYYVYTEDSNSEYTEGADESEIVNNSIDYLLECFNKNEQVLNKLKVYKF